MNLITKKKTRWFDIKITISQIKSALPWQLRKPRMWGECQIASIEIVTYLQIKRNILANIIGTQDGAHVWVEVNDISIDAVMWNQFPNLKKKTIMAKKTHRVYLNKYYGYGTEYLKENGAIKKWGINELKELIN